VTDEGNPEERKLSGFDGQLRSRRQKLITRERVLLQRQQVTLPHHRQDASMRRTAKPVSSAWKVTRSINPVMPSWGCSVGAGTLCRLVIPILWKLPKEYVLCSLSTKRRAHIRVIYYRVKVVLYH